MRKLANNWLHINIKSFRSPEVWIDTIFVQNNLRHALFNQLIIQRSTKKQLNTLHHQSGR